MINPFEKLSPGTDNGAGFNATGNNYGIIKHAEETVFNFLKEDKKLPKPVILSITPRAVTKLVYYLSGLSESPVAIGIAGETASGKSSFASDISDCINTIYYRQGCEEKITKINSDNYYYDRSKEVKAAGNIANFLENYDFDSPAAVELSLLKTHIQKLVNGIDVMTPRYMMDGSAVRHDNHILCKSNPVIVSEGIFNLNEQVKDVFDICIYVHVSPEEQKERWFRRAAERDFKGKQAEKVFNSVMQKTAVNIKPTLKHADIIINGEARREDYSITSEKLFNIFTGFSKTVATVL